MPVVIATVHASAGFDRPLHPVLHPWPTPHRLAHQCRRAYRHRQRCSNAKRSLFYRPIKQYITLRLDADLIAWFKAHSETLSGKGYQTTINQALRDYVNQRTAPQ